MSIEGNVYESIDFGQRDNPTPCYDNATSGCQQALPEMDATQGISYPPPPKYAQTLPDMQPGGVGNPPPYYINNPSNNPGWTHPQEASISLPQPNKNHQQIQMPPPMSNSQFLTLQLSEPMAPGTVMPQPMAFPSPQFAMVPGMMPPQQYPQNCPYPGTMMVNTVQPMVVTTQTTVFSNTPPPCRDYLPWSILNLLCCCLIFGIVALIFSLQTRSAKKYQDWESAKRKSRLALGFNLTAMLLGIAIIIIIIVLSVY
ncbi:uncharacterized protein LOC143933497 [Lithobates pipiens]